MFKLNYDTVWMSKYLYETFPILNALKKKKNIL